jgi:hypothetical protein
LASIGYGWLFAIGAAVNLLALVMLHWTVREPRWARVGQVQPTLSSQDQQL